MYKPLSEKSLNRLYEKANIDEKDVKLVHKYLLCFSNLYGLIEIPDAYYIYKEYEKDDALTYDKFIELIKIIQREKQSYSIVDMNDIYSAEPKNVLDYLVNNKLNGYGYRKFDDICYLEENRINRPFYKPNKGELFHHEKDLFWLSKNGLKMKEFIDNLKTNGTFHFYGVREVILDLNNKPVKGKKLKDFKCYTHFEKSSIEYEKRDSTRKYLEDKFNKTAAEKVLDRIEDNLRIGERYFTFNEDLQKVVEYMDKQLGVVFDEDSLKKFFELYIELNNKSNLWQNRGYSPEKLHSVSSSGRPTLTIGPGIKKMLEEEGTYEQFTQLVDDFNKHFSKSLDIDTVACALQDTSDDRPLYYSKSLNNIFSLDEDRFEEYSNELIPLPSQDENNEYQMMIDFIDLIEDQTIRNSMMNAIQGEGADIKFKVMLVHHDLMDKWFEYVHERYKELAILWCKKHQIKVE